ncbi:SulP family inorganic anion transporter [Methylocella tundrae]|nr:SulP family inorganic anion transporter [Methylocella tundrae]WPP06506.1 SulP family inorganic anion transporter [Methylocella tundrae]
MAAGILNPSFVELFTPKLITVLRERYGLSDLRADAVAGLTVAIVALPLSMAIAIASGVTPDRGLYTAIIGGFFVSALGGSRFQIGGPAGAFIVLVAATVAEHGVDGLILATLLSGLILVAIGFLRLGAFIKYIPYPVTVGFSAGIATIIFASQIKDLFGLTLSGPEPGPLLEKLSTLGKALPTTSPSAVGVAAATIAVILLIRRYRPHWPGLLIAVTIASAAGFALGLPIETIGTHFGGIPRSLPAPYLPAMSYDKITAVLPAAFSFALLGSIESLLSAVVADSMSGRRHRSNCELVAQGVANMASALFGGICVTGTIARTATNVRAGARGPIAGMLHSLFLLIFMMVAAPLASYIPLAALAGVLTIVAWNMAEKHAFATLLRASRGAAIVLLATFLLTIFRDLATGILVGFSLASLIILRRMSQSLEVETLGPMDEDQSDRSEAGEAYDATLTTDRDIVAFRISGAFFFGAAAGVSAVLDEIAEQPKAYVIDLSAVQFFDSTAAVTIGEFARKARRAGALVYVSGASKAVRRALLLHSDGVRRVHFKDDVKSAVSAARAAIARAPVAHEGMSVP